MTIQDLLQRYEQTNNKRGIELLSAIVEQRTARFLENEQDEAIRKDLENCKEWRSLKERSYINKRGHWVIIPPISTYF